MNTKPYMYAYLDYHNKGHILYDVFYNGSRLCHDYERDKALEVLHSAERLYQAMESATVDLEGEVGDGAMTLIELMTKVQEKKL